MIYDMPNILYSYFHFFKPTYNLFLTRLPDKQLFLLRQPQLMIVCAEACNFQSHDCDKYRTHMIISSPSVYKLLDFQNALKKTTKVAAKNFSAPKLLRICKLIDDRSRCPHLAVAHGKVMNIS